MTAVPGAAGSVRPVKYLLMIHVNPSVLEVLPEDEQKAMIAAHESFQEITGGTGELVGFVALDGPGASTTVRVRDGAPAVTDGPYVEAKEFLAGYYIVDTATPERAHELAALIPDAAFTAIEVRPVVNSSGSGA